MNSQCVAYDVVVVGGGTAGVIAAIQSARAGVKTLLIEKNGMLGGTITVGGVNFPGLFHAWGKQIIAGIGWDLVHRAAKLSNMPLPDFKDYHRRHWHLQVRINRAVYAALADAEVLTSGATVLFHTMLASATQTSDGWNLQICCKEGLKNIAAKVVIDATGDANAAYIAGLPTRINEHLQPGTLMFKLGGYDPQKLDYDQLQKAFDQAVEEKRILRSDMASGGAAVKHFLGTGGDNCMHVLKVDGSTSAGRTEAELQSRQILLRLLTFFHSQPGLESVSVDYCAPECGIRESRTIVGRKTITGEDYSHARKWDDALCYSFYPIDIHRHDGHGIDVRPLEEGRVPSIPRGAMLPETGRNFIVAGRCISADQAAASALRVQASCMAIGQAAGAMAALTVRQNQSTDQLLLKDIDELLHKNGAIIPERLS